MSSHLVGRIAKELLWTVEELVDEAVDPRSISRADGQSSAHVAIEGDLRRRLGSLLGEPLRDISDCALLARTDPLYIGRSLAVCAEVLPQIRHLSSGLERLGAARMLEAVIKLAEFASDASNKEARQVMFDATDHLVHCLSFVLPASELEHEAVPHLDRLATTILRDGNVDAEMHQRWLVRRADVLRVCPSHS